MSLRFLALTTLLLVSAAPTSAGVTLWTPLAQAGADGSVACSAVNIGKKNVDITLAMFDDSSAFAASDSCPDRGPGGICLVSVPGPFLGYCKIISSGSKKSVRGGLLVTDANGNSVLSLETP